MPALTPTFAEGFDAAADSADMWRALSRDQGQRILHLLIRYITDRASHGERWVAALEQTDVPLAFVWGMLDPVSGAHMAERIRERIPRRRCWRSTMSRTGRRLKLHSGSPRPCSTRSALAMAGARSDMPGLLSPAAWLRLPWSCSRSVAAPGRRPPSRAAPPGADPWHSLQRAPRARSGSTWCARRRAEISCSRRRASPPRWRWRDGSGRAHRRPDRAGPAPDLAPCLRRRGPAAGRHRPSGGAQPATATRRRPRSSRPTGCSCSEASNRPPPSSPGCASTSRALPRRPSTSARRARLKRSTPG